MKTTYMFCKPKVVEVCINASISGMSQFVERDPRGIDPIRTSTSI